MRRSANVNSAISGGQSGWSSWPSRRPPGPTAARPSKPNRWLLTPDERRVRLEELLQELPSRETLTRKVPAKADQPARAASLGKAEPTNPNHAMFYREFRALRECFLKLRETGANSEGTHDVPIELDSPWREALTPRGDVIESYIETRRKDVDNGDLSAGRFSRLIGHQRYFDRWLNDRQASIEMLDGATWDEWGRHCRELVANDACSAAYARDRFREGKQLLRWAAATGRLKDLPRNLDDVKPKRVEASIVKIIEVGELRNILNAADERLRLWLLLMLNTGAGRQDLSDLRADELDLKASTIARNRSKTKQHASMPVVQNSLWPETIKLLHAHGPKSEEHVLVNSDNRALVSTTIVDGKLKKSDAAKSAYFRLGKKLGRNLPPLKLLRKTGASIIAESHGFDVARRYLGPAGDSIADRHYIQISNERLSEALGAMRAKLLPPKQTGRVA